MVQGGLFDMELVVGMSWSAGLCFCARRMELKADWSSWIGEGS